KARASAALLFLARKLAQRVGDGLVVGIKRERLFPSLARQAVLAQLAVDRALHRQQLGFVRILALQIHAVDERQLVVARAVKLAHARDAAQVAGAGALAVGFLRAGGDRGLRGVVDAGGPVRTRGAVGGWRALERALLHQLPIGGGEPARQAVVGRALA